MFNQLDHSEYLRDVSRWLYERCDMIQYYENPEDIHALLFQYYGDGLYTDSIEKLTSWLLTYYYKQQKSERDAFLATRPVSIDEIPF